MESQGGCLKRQSCHTLSAVRASVQPGSLAPQERPLPTAPLPRNAARGLAPTCPRSTHPPFWGAGLA